VRGSLGLDFNWPRMSEDTLKEAFDGNFELFKDGVSVQDIRQGQLGDCYYLSAMSVMNG